MIIWQIWYVLKTYFWTRSALDVSITAVKFFFSSVQLVINDSFKSDVNDIVYKMTDNFKELAVSLRIKKNYKSLMTLDKNIKKNPQFNKIRWNSLYITLSTILNTKLCYYLKRENSWKNMKEKWQNKKMKEY